MATSDKSVIKAPYNFVPLPDKVVFPEWSGAISHDIPFSDGLSGTIKVRLTAHTPIFIRNGHSQNDADSGKSFSREGSGEGRFFIPGSAFKGAVRSVLEIMSFGKMRLDKSMRFAQREWDNKKLYSLKSEAGKIKCGWLKEDKDGYFIEDCGTPWRISHKELDNMLGEDLFERYFSREERFNLNKPCTLRGKDYDPKSAEFKYTLVDNCNSSLDILAPLRFEIKDESNGKKIVRYNPAGDCRGRIVFTGQPDQWVWPRKPRGGKFYEFVFPEVENGNRFRMTEEEFIQYKFIYSSSPDWQYLKKQKLDKEGIPVFFRVENGELKDWGLALLYKLPYEKTPFDTLPEAHRDEKRPDMADCIFGYIGENADTGLKGRVQFSPLWSDNAEEDQEVTLILGSPKPSYYPNYICQEDKEDKEGKVEGDYHTYNDGRIKGWKRYILRDKTWVKKSDSEKVNTVLYPLTRGSRFEGIINFHNLKPEELGALLSALTFHGNEKTRYHQLGMARPYGFGKVSLELTAPPVIRPVGELKEGALPTPDEYMNIFENYLDRQLDDCWRLKPSIKELLTMARYSVEENKPYEYMNLDMNGNNDFTRAKGGKNGKEFPKECLRSFSEISGYRDMTPDEENELRNKREEMKKAERLRAAEEEKELAQKKAMEEEKAAQEAKERENAEQQKRKDEKMERSRTLGLRVLNGVPESNIVPVSNFKILYEKLEAWSKVVGDPISDNLLKENVPHLEEALCRLAAKPSRDEKKKKLWINRESTYWKRLEAFLSKDIVDSLFAKVNPA